MHTLELLQTLIQRQSITPKECDIYALIKSEFDSINTNALECVLLEQETKGVKNLFMLFYPKGKKLEHLAHFCFAGHIDVVPAGGNEAEAWDFPPFSGAESSGYIYGRGAQDMKGGVACFISAMKNALDSGLQTCALSLLLTSDEEGDGTYGTQYMLELLRQKALLPHFCIVAEPTSNVKSGDVIKIGRRGSINGVITIQGKQGHVAYPSKCVNPIELLGAQLGKLAGVNLDKGDSAFCPSKLVITDIRGGMEVVNVTPSALKIMFNVRNSPLSDESSIKSYIDSVLSGIPYTLSLKTSSQPFITSQNSALIDMICQSIKDVAKIAPELSTNGGTSDARFFAAFGVEVIELGVPNDSIHAVNERVKISDINMLESIFSHFLQNFKEQN